MADESYIIRLLNHTGALQAEFSDIAPVTTTGFISLYCTHIENAPGYIRFEIDGASRYRDAFIEDAILEVRRRNDVLQIDWYREWVGFLFNYQVNELIDGTTRLVAYGFEPLDLARRATVAYKPGTAFADKSVLAGETAIKQYAGENMGSLIDPSRTTTLGALQPGFILEPDQGRGAGWEGAQSGRNLYKSIKEVALATGLAFDIVNPFDRITDPSEVVWELRTYLGQTGADRSLIGYDNNTGLNGAGNVPVIFSTERQTAERGQYNSKRSGSANITIARGRGKDANQRVRTKENYSTTTDSPWGRREKNITASGSQDTDQALDDVAAGALARLPVKETFNITPIQTRALAYGKDYFNGDLATLQVGGESANKIVRTTSISVTPGDQGEKIVTDFGDI